MALLARPPRASNLRSASLRSHSVTRDCGSMPGLDPIPVPRIYIQSRAIYTRQREHHSLARSFSSTFSRESLIGLTPQLTMTQMQPLRSPTTVDNEDERKESVIFHLNDTGDHRAGLSSAPPRRRR